MKRDVEIDPRVLLLIVASSIAMVLSPGLLFLGPIAAIWRFQYGVGAIAVLASWAVFGGASGHAIGGRWAGLVMGLGVAALGAFVCGDPLRDLVGGAETLDVVDVEVETWIGPEHVTHTKGGTRRSRSSGTIVTLTMMGAAPRILELSGTKREHRWRAVMAYCDGTSRVTFLPATGNVIAIGCPAVLGAR